MQKNKIFCIYKYKNTIFNVAFEFFCLSVDELDRFDRITSSRNDRYPKPNQQQTFRVS